MNTRSPHKRFNLKVAGVLILASFCEVAVTVLLTKYLGALLTYSLFAVPTILGLLIQSKRRLFMQKGWGEVREGLSKGNTYEERMRRTRPSYVVTTVEVCSY
jgi:UPF0716 family protein affecting phage T7 exclusion